MKKTALKHYSFLIVLVLGIIGVLFRFFYLDRGLTYEELYTAASSWPGLSLLFLWENIWSNDINAPLYNIFLYFWNKPFKFPTELWLRLPSVLASLGTLYLVTFHTPRFLNKTGRLTLIALFATSFGMIYYAQEARCFSLLLFAATWLLFTTIDFAEHLKQHRMPSTQAFLLFFAVGLATCYLHFFGAVWFFSLSIVLSGYSQILKQKRFIFIAAPMLVLVCYFPWLYYVSTATPSFEGWGSNYETSVATIHVIRLFFANSVAAAVASIVLVMGITSAFRTERSLFGATQVIVPVVSILVLLFLMVLASSKINLFFPGGFLVAIPAVYLLFTVFFGSLVKSDAWTAVLLPVILLLSMGLTITSYSVGLKKGPNATKRAIKATSRNLQEKDLLIYLHSSDYPSPVLEKMFDYYPEYFNMDKMPITLTKESLHRNFTDYGSAVIFIPNCSDDTLKDLAVSHPVFLTETNWYSDACVITVVPAKHTQ